jgi:hypothetical protein
MQKLFGHILAKIKSTHQVCLCRGSRSVCFEKSDPDPVKSCLDSQRWFLVNGYQKLSNCYRKFLFLCSKMIYKCTGRTFFSINMEKFLGQSVNQGGKT